MIKQTNGSGPIPDSGFWGNGSEYGLVLYSRTMHPNNLKAALGPFHAGCIKLT